jgi:hypothetical protein
MAWKGYYEQFGSQHQMNLGQFNLKPGPGEKLFAHGQDEVG